MVCLLKLMWVGGCLFSFSSAFQLQLSEKNDNLVGIATLYLSVEVEENRPVKKSQKKNVKLSLSMKNTVSDGVFSL